MAFCSELATILLAWLVVFVLPSLALFGGLGWLAWRHERRWASFAAAALAAAACIGTAFLFRGDADGVWATLGFVPLLLAHAWAAARSSRRSRSVALAATAFAPLGLLAFVLLDVLATATCHTV